MRENHYSIKELMQEHEDYEFIVKYEAKTKQITTRVRMPSNLLANGIAFTLADLQVDDNTLEQYLDDIKLQIRQIRKQKNATDK